MTEANDIAAFMNTDGTLGADNSLFLRPLRRFFDDGDPPGLIYGLSVKIGERAFPMGMISRTRGKRLVFWPVLPKQPSVVDLHGKQVDLDHLTLEFPSQRVHGTYFKSSGKRGHYGAADFGQQTPWELVQFPNSGLAMFFTLMVKMDVLEQQDLMIKRDIRTPPQDSERRKEVLRDFARNFQMLEIPVPGATPRPDYVCCCVYYHLDRSQEVALREEMFIVGNANDMIEGLTLPYMIGGAQIDVDSETRVIFAVACPPGRFKDAVSVGFVRKGTSKA